MEDFVTYEQAEKLADLGFDYKCIACYDEEEFEYNGEPNDYNSGYYRYNLISAPTLTQAQKWLREVKDIHIEIKYTINPQYEPWIGKVVIIEDYPEPNTIIDTDTCDTYEEALSEAIDKALELLTQQSNGNQDEI